MVGAADPVGVEIRDLSPLGVEEVEAMTVLLLVIVANPLTSGATLLDGCTIVFTDVMIL